MYSGTTYNFFQKSINFLNKYQKVELVIQNHKQNDTDIRVFLISTFYCYWDYCKIRAWCPMAPKN